MTPLNIALAVLVTFIWGVNFTFIAWGLDSFPPLMLTALRFFFTAVPLVFFLKPPKFNRTLFIYAIGTFVMQYAFVFTAMHLGASAGLTALLLQIQIFITVLLAYVILGEAVNRMQIIGMIVGVLGLGVIALNPWWRYAFGWFCLYIDCGNRLEFWQHRIKASISTSDKSHTAAIKHFYYLACHWKR